MTPSGNSVFHPSHDPRIDEYIGKSASFAQPLLVHMRSLVHQACPEVKETIKWGMPHFMYKDEILCSMAAFKAHCAFVFWKATLMKDPALQENALGETAMGHLGRITALADLPSDEEMVSYLHEAMELNEKGAKPPKKLAQKKDLQLPEDLREALSANAKAFESFENFSYTHQKEYIDWISEAKTKSTRQKRLKTAIDYMEEGKPKNWKYLKDNKSK
ncbi:YdeI/OmpD-associated family protein [Echinicola jeungdonensis]|uniref:YdeI family protein n=1 Tax=Echinicola jeungdonensis TaxID=709343 RepID=A0ABV5J3Z5_9BACT|nr:YdeI/OmpD-associated family protein [Echinicola jeungdonensis]MDN3669047.1 YdeI/OmpD-associated family protein [Echinicola jeungdonensis]